MSSGAMVFDGTISPRDIGAALVRRFSTDGEAGAAPLLERWLSGELGHRELTEPRERAGCACSEEEALEFAAPVSRSIRSSRRSCARRAARGDAVMVVSEGFDFYIADQLARAGLGDLPRAANRARFEGGRRDARVPVRRPRAAARCGNCKAQHVRRYQRAAATAR